MIHERTNVRLSEGVMQDTIQKEMTLKEKLNILSDAAKYDVSCSSSGVDRKGDGTGMGTAARQGYVTASRRMDGAFLC